MKIDGEYQVGEDPERVIAGAIDAEQRGYDAYFSSDDAHDSFIPLAVAASRTERIQLGTAITVAFARTPMTVAYSANDLQLLAKGRFILGLGSQVRGHIVRRFNMPWSKPAARMREFVTATRAIWEAWQTEGRLDFQGDFYSHTLMTPAFSPAPNPYGTPPIYLAALGDLMSQVAGEVGDGLICHPIVTARFLRESMMPAVERGLARSGRTRADFDVALPIFIATGRSDTEIATAANAVKEKVAFYSSTPAYKPVLELEGLSALQAELHALSRSGGWARMAGLIDDSVLSTFAVVGDPDTAADAIVERCGGAVDRISFYAPYDVDRSVLEEVAVKVRSRG
jgi:probable F420-dependent oxidoreductase